MSNDLKKNIINKVINLQEIVKNVIRSNQLYKTTGFLEINDLNSCVSFAESIYLKLRKILDTIESADNDDTITALQSIIEEISTLISLYGCDTLDNLIKVCISWIKNIRYACCICNV
jgi:hypothetical protein